MKRTAVIVFLLLFFFLLNACGSTENTGIQNVYHGDTNAETVDPPPPAREPEPVCDIDLVGMDAYQTFDALFDILDHAPDYEGKRIRMEGVCDVYPYPDHVVYGCIVPDPTDDCRPQGMEFVLSDAYEDYPTVGDKIIICGVLHLYEMGDYTFCNLIDCTLESSSENTSHDMDHS